MQVQSDNVEIKSNFRSKCLYISILLEDHIKDEGMFFDNFLHFGHVIVMRVLMLNL